LVLRNQKLFEEPATKNIDGWQTVQAVMTTAPKYFAHLKKQECEDEPSIESVPKEQQAMTSSDLREK
jgi:hypothetical protein